MGEALAKQAMPEIPTPEEMAEALKEVEAEQAAEPMASVEDRAVEKIEGMRAGAVNDNFAPVIDYLVNRCRESSALAEDVLKDRRTWYGCHKHITSEARKFLENKSGAVEDTKVYEWAEDYFRIGDREPVKSTPSAAKTKKPEAKKAETKAAEPAKAEKPEMKEPAPIKHKKKSKELEGQMDIFSMLGIEG